MTAEIRRSHKGHCATELETVIVVVDFEKELVPVEIEAPEIVLAVRVVTAGDSLQGDRPRA
jgi:hypothetical protein